MAVIIEEAEESSTTPNKIMDRPKRQCLNDSERSATDGSWRIGFFIVFMSWIIFCIVTLVWYQGNGNKVNVENSTESHNSSELFAPFYLWGRHWAFDAITCNLAYFQTHYDESGVIVFAANLLFAIGLLIYAIGPTRIDKLFHRLLDQTIICFAIISTFYRILIMVSKAEVDWSIPEAVFFILWYTKRHYVDEERIDFYPILRDDELPLHQFKKFPIWCIVLACQLAVLPVYCTWCLLLGSDWPSALYYVIMAASFYVALTVHHLFLMIIVCIIDRRMDSISMADNDNLEWACDKGFRSGWRYHLGTACYHATLIFPRLKALAVMNEPEFKAMLSDEKLVDRLALTQGRLHDLTLMATAVAGTDHAESLRELLRHWHTADTPDFKYFRGYAQIFRSSLALLLSTNNLTSLLLWSQGAHHDPHTVLVTWKFYLLCIFIFGIAMRNYDSVMDTILLHSKGLPIDRRKAELRFQWIIANYDHE